ncbi:MAG: class II fructose-1,6-bisphosphate aldolase [Candidatus Aenigmarchaeota archaeon]|nr:class II fructose-1,6-bisphosphate aldolase [Candidatus Aenigmarchaeota archaeon]
MLTTLTKALADANKKNYAVGAFNVNNMEICQAVIRAAEKLKSPVIIQTSEGAIAYAGIKYLKAITEVAAQTSAIPTVLHLDHGRDMNIVKDCIRLGWTGIMYDGSHLSFEKNVKNTLKVVKLAERKEIGVEGELGTIGGAEDIVSARQILYTQPEAAKEFVEKTGVDALAIAIGTSHGAYKFKGKAKLDIKLLAEIKKKVKIPLVLHGASGVPAAVVAKAQKYGAKLGKPEGVPDSQIKEAIKNGINKINTDTDLRLAFDAAVREVIATKPEVFDPRKILGPAREFIQKIVEHRIKLFGSVGRG